MVHAETDIKLIDIKLWMVPRGHMDTLKAKWVAF